MSHQSSPFHGYRDLSPEEIDLINGINRMGEECGVLVERLLDMTGPEGLRYDTPQPGLDGRWVSIGITQLQLGFMALVRAVAKPTTF